MIKKIIFLTSITLLLTGCFDYQELNDLAIITGISIDYIDNEYVANFEVLSSKKSESKEGTSPKSYTIEGVGKTLSLAYQNAFKSLNKDPYYTHIKVVIFSEEIASNHLKEVTDYLMRDPNTRNIYYPVLAKNSLAKEILKTKLKDEEIVSEAILGSIEKTNSKENIAIKQNFEHFFDALISEEKDALLNVVSLENESLTLNNQAIFKDYKLQDILNEEMSINTLLLTNNSHYYYLKVPCEKDNSKYLTVSLYDNNKTKYEVTNKLVTITGKYNADIIEDNCNYNFRDNKTYEQLNKELANTLNKELLTTINYLKSFNSDVLEINKYYFQKTKKHLDSIDNLDVNIKSKITINKNGIIFGVNKE